VKGRDDKNGLQHICLDRESMHKLRGFPDVVGTFVAVHHVGLIWDGALRRKARVLASS